MKKPTEPEVPKTKYTINLTQSIESEPSIQNILDGFNILKKNVKAKHGIDIAFSEVMVQYDDVESGYDHNGEFVEYQKNGNVYIEFCKQLDNKNYQQQLKEYLICKDQYKRDLRAYEKWHVEYEIVRENEKREYHLEQIQLGKDRAKKREEKLRSKYGDDWENIVANITASNIAKKKKVL